MAARSVRPATTALLLHLAWLHLAAAAPHLYPSANDPFASPACERAWAKPARGLAENKPHWSAYRGSLAPSALDNYNTSGLGDVVWPQWPVLTDPSLATELADVNRRGLWLTDISNYVPGDPSDCDPFDKLHISGVCEYHLPRAVSDLLNESLGERFTGMDNGEQDGRYLSFTPGQYRGRGGDPSSRPSELRSAYLHFARFFDRMADDLGNKLMSLNSIWFPHYFARTGFYTMLGAETAQGLPNAQLFYSFLRGAAKQFGQWIWGNASIYNRFGFKTCKMTNVTVGSADTAQQQQQQQQQQCVCNDQGTSLSLMRRLMYQQVMYGAKIFGFETLGGCGDPSPDSPISPIATIHSAGQAFAAKTELGVHVTTVAVLADFMTGFEPPRQLYSSLAWRVWGNIPFDEGAFFMSNVLNTIYPGYTDGSYWHDERGFMTPTPFGDVADVLLSDCPADILARYPVVVLATDIVSSHAEVEDKLAAFIEAGGTLVLTMNGLGTSGLLGLTVSTQCTLLSAGASVELRGVNGSASSKVLEAQALRVCPVSSSNGHLLLPIAWTLKGQNMTLGFEVAMGKGRAIVLATSGMAAEPIVPGVAGKPVVPPTQPDTPLHNPFPMASYAHALLSGVLAAQAPFTAGDGLTVVTNRVSARSYLVAVANPSLQQLPFRLVSHVGTAASVTEIELVDAPLAAAQPPGYTPPGVHKLGFSRKETIAGLDQRIFTVTLADESATLLPTLAPPASPNRIALPLPDTEDLTESVMLRPSFSQHFSGAVLDWKYVERRTAEELQKEGRWAFMRNISLLVDFTSGLDLYPGLRLCNNSVQYEQSIARMQKVLGKMDTLVNASSHTMGQTFSADAIVASHRSPENGQGYYKNNQTEKTTQCYADTLRALKRLATEFPSIQFHLHVGEPGRKPGLIDEAELTLALDFGDLKNIDLGAHMAAMADGGFPAYNLTSKIGVLFAAAESRDPYNFHVGSLALPVLLGWNGPLATLSGAQHKLFSQYLNQSYEKAARKRTDRPWVVIDAELPRHAGIEVTEDAEYAEVKQLESMIAEATAVDVPVLNSSSRFCDDNDDGTGFYIKTGGVAWKRGGWDGGAKDKCCRQSAKAECYWFPTMAACESALRNVTCLSCTVISDHLGCPEW